LLGKRKHGVYDTGEKKGRSSEMNNLEERQFDKTVDVDLRKTRCEDV